jgi:hypothetical protein
MTGERLAKIAGIVSFGISEADCWIDAATSAAQAELLPPKIDT